MDFLGTPDVGPLLFAGLSVLSFVTAFIGVYTGAAGGVLLRPFARLIASTGDSVTTYGDPWNMN